MITVHWHLILYIIVMVLCIYKMGDGEGGMDFTPALWFFAAIILTAIYGGIFWW
jgi:uncharacterized membrane protein YhdT